MRPFGYDMKPFSVSVFTLNKPETVGSWPSELLSFTVSLYTMAVVFVQETTERAWWCGLKCYLFFKIFFQYWKQNKGVLYVVGTCSATDL